MQSAPWSGPEFVGTVQRCGAVGYIARATHGFIEESEFCLTRWGAEAWVRRTVRAMQRDASAPIIRVTP